MSFKGIQKAFVRAPQNFRQKFNMGQQTEDAVYIDAERRFKELESETKRLADESKRYHKAVNEMLDHQLGFSKAIEEIYKPISGRVSDPNSLIPEGNPEGIEACEQYREVLNELKDTLKPDLELIESRIVQPAHDLLQIIASIRKMATKRNHKQLDLDRHQNSLSKYQNKANRTPKDEEKMYKCENEVAVAQQEFDYFNEMMKQELPILFQLEGQFVKPLFISLYYMQLNVFYTLASRMEEMKIPYFDLSQDIIEAYNVKRGDVEERTEAIGITQFKVGHAKNKLELTRRRFEAQQAGSPGGAYSAAPAYDGAVAGAAVGGIAGATAGVTAGSGAYGATSSYGSAYGATPTTAPTSAYSSQYGAQPAYGAEKAPYGGITQAPTYSQPPPYGSGTPTYGSASPVPGATAVSSPVAAVSPTYGAPVPAPVPVPQAAPAAETCTALYDYVAQAAGDLSFKAGDIITVVERTSDQNGWWTGISNGAQGVFPGNYVQLN